MHFKSGSNRAPDIVAFGHVLRQPFGVVAHELREEQIALVCSAKTDVFVDSGAFGEVDRDLNVVRPMTDGQWRDILALYLRLARILRTRLTVVAPDRVGDQLETLTRMFTYAEQMYECASLSSRVLVPIQKGAFTMAEFYHHALDALGADDPLYVPAIPMKKDATSLAELAQFVQQARPHAMHLLGIGPHNHKFAEIARICRGVPFTCDSNVLTASVGRSGKRPRPLTRASDHVEQSINERLGPKLIRVGGTELMLDGATSECGDRFAMWANWRYAPRAYTDYVWPMRDPARLRQIKKAVAICHTFGTYPQILLNTRDK